MRKIIGAFEEVGFPDFGLNAVVAKIDTGAASGAVHATNITEILLPTGEKAVKFRPFGRKKEVIANAFTQKRIKSSNGISELRYVIPTTVVIKGVQYPINVSLADRALMSKGVLIGRKFLRQHGFVVDTSKGTKYVGEVKK